MQKQAFLANISHMAQHSHSIIKKKYQANGSAVQNTKFSPMISIDRFTFLKYVAQSYEAIPERDSENNNLSIRLYLK